MRLLAIHQNFPDPFKHMAAEWVTTPGWDVIGIGRDTAPGYPNNPGFKLVRYKPHRGVGKEQHPYLRRMEEAVLHGQAVARILLQLKRKGWTPDARLVHYCEWFYNAPPLDVINGKVNIDRAEWPYADIGFDPEFPTTFDDLARTHFLGKVPYEDYKRVLQVSSAHCYLTYPFVLSWSCLEAMATGCLMVASDTAPVREVLQDRRNGHITASVSPEAVAASLASALEGQQGKRAMGEAARCRVAGLARALGVSHFDALLADRPNARAPASMEAGEIRSPLAAAPALQPCLGAME